MTTTVQAPDLLKLNVRDNVAVALRPILAGEEISVDDHTVTALKDIPQGE